MPSSLPEAVMSAFLNGEHVCRHQSGIWNSVFLDQFGEQTYIRYGKTKGGLVGKSLSSEQVSEWILSHHLCNTLSILMDTVYEESVADSYTKTSHKEESKSRRRLDSEDRNKIGNELKQHTNPLIVTADEGLCNIINGRSAADEVNVDNALAIGQAMASKFSGAVPDGFHSPIKKSVVTMETLKKRVKVGDVSVFDTEKLYARLLVISQSRDIQLSEVFKHELSPVPSALFDEYGDMRKGSKATLVQKLAVFATSPLGPVQVEIVDGNEAIYHTSWPKNTTVKSFASIFLHPFQSQHDTYIIFDQYMEHSVKSHERQRRTKGAKPTQYRINPNTVLPDRDVIMKNGKKKQSSSHRVLVQN